MRFLTTIERLADSRAGSRLIGGPATVVEVTERYARQVLHLRKGQPTTYRGLRLQCIGSKRWRERQPLL